MIHMKTKKKLQLLFVVLGFLSSILLPLSSKAGAQCEGIDGNVIYYCDGVGNKICHSIKANGQTYECHGQKTTRPAPFVN